VRGSALARPAVAGALAGFILTAWHGHRDDSDLPPQVREVWAEKFAPRRARGGGQSNVDVAILDASGKVVRWFDSLEHTAGRMELRGDRVEQYWMRMLSEARTALELPAATATGTTVRLPVLQQGAGVRVFAWLEDPGMPAYAAPTVEIVPTKDEDWRVFTAPENATKIDAAAAMPWLQHVYPAGVMERTDQRTKYPFTIARVEGELGLEPAGTKDGETFALLTGKVTLFDTGGDGFCFRGDLTAVLTWRNGGAVPASLRGVFEGTYPRTGPQGRRELPMRAAFESLAAVQAK